MAAAHSIQLNYITIKYYCMQEKYLESCNAQDAGNCIHVPSVLEVVSKGSVHHTSAANKHFYPSLILALLRAGNVQIMNKHECIWRLRIENESPVLTLYVIFSIGN